MKTTIDYSQKENWCKFPEITKDVDTFYIFATEYILGSFEEGAPDYGSLDNKEMIEGMGVEYIGHATTYADDTNVFAPYYRQSGLKYAGKIVERDGNLDAALLGMPYNDIVDALDYYFEHYNEGRPFIIAGHSQGSALVKQVLFRYFKEHPDYYQRMVAAYVIGYAVTKEELETYPYLKFATGESDAGVIVSWNTEGPKNAAQVNLARGSVITNAKAAPMPEDAAKIAAAFFGPDGRHGEDYTFYYNNIKANVAKRIATYKASL